MDQEDSEEEEQSGSELRSSTKRKASKAYSSASLRTSVLKSNAEGASKARRMNAGSSAFAGSTTRQLSKLSASSSGRMAAGNALSPSVPVYTSAYRPQRDYTSERDTIVYLVFEFQRRAYEVDATGPTSGQPPLSEEIETISIAKDWQLFRTERIRQKGYLSSGMSKYAFQVCFSLCILPYIVRLIPLPGKNKR